MEKLWKSSYQTYFEPRAAALCELDVMFFLFCFDWLIDWLQIYLFFLFFTESDWKLSEYLKEKCDIMLNSVIHIAISSKAAWGDRTGSDSSHICMTEDVLCPGSISCTNEGFPKQPGNNIERITEATSSYCWMKHSLHRQTCWISLINRIIFFRMLQWIHIEDTYFSHRNFY